jgi:hypothetical protein
MCWPPQGKFEESEGCPLRVRSNLGFKTGDQTSPPEVYLLADYRCTAQPFWPAN